MLTRSSNGSSVSCTFNLGTFYPQLFDYFYDSLQRREDMRVCKFEFECQSGCSCVLTYDHINSSCPVMSYHDRVDYPLIITPNISTVIFWKDAGFSNFFPGAFDKLKEIEVLRLVLSYNKLVEIDSTHFEGLQKLYGLFLDNNEITRLHLQAFHDLANLRYLILSQNNISVIHVQQFVGLVNLTVLALDFNHITEIIPRQFEGLTNLMYLLLGNNRIGEIPAGLFAGLSKMRFLFLDHNSLSILNLGQFTGLVSLYRLQLNHNTISELNPGLFTGLSKLFRLYLDHNSISKLYLKQFVGLTKLHKLELSDNAISELHQEQFEGLTNLNILDVSNNKLYEINSRQFIELTNIELLYLRHNNIYKINVGAFSGLTNLVLLDLQNNKIESLEDLIFQGTKLYWLYLNDNSIKVLHPKLFEGLRLGTLQLHNNDISELESDHFESLEYMRLFKFNNNNLKTINLPKTTIFNRVRIVFLNRNRLTTLDFGILKQMPELVYLNLSENFINRLDSGLLFNSISLELINLTRNNLYMVNYKSFTGFTLDTRILVDNEATCCFTQNATCIATTGKSQFLTCGRLLGDSVQRVFMWILGLFTLVCNCGVLFYKMRNNVGNKVQRLLISSLSMSDLLMGIYMVMIVSADEYYKDYFPSEAWRISVPCKIAGILSFLSSEASIFFVTLITIDRLMGIRFTFSKYRIETTSSRVLVLLSWVVALALSLTAMFITTIDPGLYDVSEVCTGLPLSRSIVTETHHDYLYVLICYSHFYFDSPYNVEIGRKPAMYFGIAVFTGLNLLCFIVVSVSYFVIFLTSIQTARSAGRSRNYKNERRMAARMGAIVLTDLACWLPIIILSLLVQSGRYIVSSTIYTWIVTFVLPINSAINPFLYTIVDASFDYVEKRNKKRTKSNPNT